jgi:hypothetical protein
LDETEKVFSPQVGNVSSMLSPISHVGRLRNRFFTPRVSRHLIPAPDEDDDDVGPKDCEGDDLDPDVLAILEDNPLESDYALPSSAKVLSYLLDNQILF